MRNSATAFDPGLGLDPRRAQRAVSRGRTPLFQLARASGEVWVKREGRQGSGSFFDRVARAQLRKLAPRCPVVLVGWTSHTLAVLAATRLQERSVVVVDVRELPRRLAALGQLYGAKVERVTSLHQADAVAGQQVRSGAIWLKPDDGPALVEALREVRDELDADGLPLQRLECIVLPALGLSSAEVAQAFGVPSKVVELVEVADDVPTDLEPDVACRRMQLGHREGILVSPSGAAVLDRAIDQGVHRNAPVLALLTEDGHRHLGWW